MALGLRRLGVATQFCVPGCMHAHSAVRRHANRVRKARLDRCGRVPACFRVKRTQTAYRNGKQKSIKWVTGYKAVLLSGFSVAGLCYQLAQKCLWIMMLCTRHSTKARQERQNADDV